MKAFARLVLYFLTVLNLATTPIGAASEQPFDPTYADYNSLLKTYVTDGSVNYNGLKKSEKLLKSFLESAGQVPHEHFRSWPEEEQLSFLINLYNAATLQLVLDHYPVKSIKDIGGFFKGPWSMKIVRLFGDKITLDNLEHGIIRKRYSEPRVHMALVCAARSCPPLRSEAYMAEKLNEQLDDQTHRFLSSPAGLVIDQSAKIVYLSSIFKWYGEDFVRGFTPEGGFKGLDETERAVAHFAGQYTGPAEKAFLSAGDYKIRYSDYDWSLNARQ